MQHIYIGDNNVLATCSRPENTGGINKYAWCALATLGSPTSPVENFHVFYKILGAKNLPKFAPFCTVLSVSYATPRALHLVY